MAFQKAVRRQAKCRIGVDGPSGAGKTFTMLRMGTEFARAAGGDLAFIDTERGSALKYAKAHDKDPEGFDFAHTDLAEYHPERYILAIEEAAKAGFPVLAVDSLSHAWAGKGGALELADKGASKYGGNRWASWSDVTPLQNRLVDTLLAYPGHILVGMRSKMEYIQTETNGKKSIEKVGLAPVQREGIEYEFDVMIDMDTKHNGVITKTRLAFLDGKIIEKPGEDLARQMLEWLEGGAPAPPTPAENWAALKAWAAENNIPEESLRRTAASVVGSKHPATWTPQEMTTIELRVKELRAS